MRRPYNYLLLSNQLNLSFSLPPICRSRSEKSKHIDIIMQDFEDYQKKLYFLIAGMTLITFIVPVQENCNNPAPLNPKTMKKMEKGG